MNGLVKLGHQTGSDFHVTIYQKDLTDEVLLRFSIFCRAPVKISPLGLFDVHL